MRSASLPARSAAPSCALRRSRPGFDPVAAGERRVEAAQAVEAAGQRDLRDRQRRVGQQLLGQQQPPRLQVLQRRNAVLGDEDAAQVAVGDAEAPGQLGDTAVLAARRRVVDRLRRLARQRLRGVHHGPWQPRSRRDLGAAFQARPEGRGLGLGRRREEATVAAHRRAHAADRAAVDAGRRDADEQLAVEARIAGDDGLVGGVGIEGYRCAGRAARGARGCIRAV